MTIKVKLNSLLPVFLFTCMLTYAIATSPQPNSTLTSDSVRQTQLRVGVSEEGFVKKDYSQCDVYDGEWIYEEYAPDLYNSNSTHDCPYMHPQFECRSNGRPDKDYLKYKWQPKACNLPRFDGEDFLTRHRGKNVLFVGDSLSLNQWASLTCMLYKSVSKNEFKLNITTIKNDKIFYNLTFLSYNTNIMMSKTPYLVGIKKTGYGRVLTLDSISIQSENLWMGMDVVIFNSWHWWLHNGTNKGWDLIGHGDKMVKDMDRFVAFEIGLTTWAKCVDKNINKTKTKIFYQGVSPDHINGTEWGRPNGSCLGEKEPTMGSTYPGGQHQAEVSVEKVIAQMSTPVHLLNVTHLSQLRKDGHPSKYGTVGGSNKYPDCSHWCLAGVPDTWNMLFYTAIINMTDH